MSEKRGSIHAIASPTVTIEEAQEALDAAIPLRLCVNYRPRDARTGAVEAGVITAVGTELILVRYWGERESKATTPECLTWAYPR